MNRQYRRSVRVIGKEPVANLPSWNDTSGNLTLGRQPKRDAVQIGIKPIRLGLPTTPRRPTQRRGRRSIADVIPPDLELHANGLCLFVDGLFIPRHAQGRGLAPPRDEVVEQNSLLAIRDGDTGEVGSGARDRTAGHNVGLLLEG